MSAGAQIDASPHRLLLASAGAGKTFQLTNHYLRLLARGEDPARVLATTFTRAAAGEILHRALNRLAEGALEAEALETLRQHVDPSLTHDSCAATLLRMTGALHRLSIMTIDAFFSRCLSTFAMDLGLAPGWRMIDEEENARVRAEAIDRTVREADREQMLELLRDLQGDEAPTRAHESIARIVRAGHEALLATEDSEEAWTAIRPAGSALQEAALSKARRALSEMPLPTTKTGEARRHWRSNVTKAMEAAEAGDWERFASLGLVGRILAGERMFDRGEIEREHLDCLTPLIEHARHALTRVHGVRTESARRLLTRFDAIYREEKRALGGVTFDDAPRLLKAAGATGDLEHLYFRLDATLRHVLLDEFQDTSMAQFGLLFPILDELLSQGAEDRSVFCVGDVKQSLYAWRQAEPSLLPALAEKWPALRRESLSRSWRSSAGVLDAVNAMFSSMGRNEALASDPAALAAGRAWDEGFEAHVAARDLTGGARLVVADEEEGADEGDRASRRAALRTCARLVKEHHERAPGATIAVIVRTRKDLRSVLSMLKHEGVDASEQSGNPLVDAPPVAAACSMLRLIDHPGHTAAAHHVASSPLGSVVGLPADASKRRARRLVSAIASALRRRIGAVGCAGLLAEWRRACAASMDERSAARFDQFIDLAERFDASGRGGASDLAALAEERRVDEPGGTRVRVMTIHAAKGLEFDVVVTPLITGQSWRVSHDRMIMTRDDPLGPVTGVTRYPSEMMRSLHPDLQAAHAAQMQRDVNEELCCLYVAATRAKRRLELVVPADREGRAGTARSGWSLKPDHVVRAALAPDQPATPGATLWRSTPCEEWADDLSLAGEAKREESAERVALRVTAPARRSGARLAGAAASRAASRGPVDAAGLLEAGDDRSRTRGALLHLFFEQIEWLDDSPPNEAALRRIAEREGFAPETLDEAIASFRRTIEAEEVRHALSRPRDAQDATHVVFRERPFAIRASGGEGDMLLEGRFDRLVASRRGGVVERVEVIDFKSDAVAEGASEEDLRAHAERHRGQMEAYRRAASRQFSIDEQRVVTRLVMLGPGRVVTLDRSAGA